MTTKVNPWAKIGWSVSDTPVKESSCCGVHVSMSRGDGTTMGTCDKCDAVVVRINPTTGQQEIPDTTFWT